MSKDKVFVDANVWFSAFYKEGVCSKLLRKFKENDKEIVISEQVLEEIIRNIKLKIPNALELVIEAIKELDPTVVKNPLAEDLKLYCDLAKLHDLPILVSAIKYDCQYLITGNKKDFNGLKINKRCSLQILTPAEYYHSKLIKH